MINGRTISLTTRVMDRMKELMQALPTWVAIPELDEIIIVNWDRRDPVIPYVKTLNDRRVIVLDVPGRRHFDSGKTRNVGIRFATGELIFTMDGDFTTDDRSFLDVLGNDCFHLRQPVTDHDRSTRFGGGTCIMPKELWSGVNGYVEGFPAWGTEDGEFYNRLLRFGYTYKRDLRGIGRINHGNTVRYKNFEWTGDREEGLRKNDEYLRTINPLTQPHDAVFCDIFNDGVLYQGRYI